MAWWHEVAAKYELEAHHVKLLRLACEAWDRGQAAREQVVGEGITVEGRFGPRTHPAVAVERDARAAFAQLIVQLGLDHPRTEKSVGGTGWRP